MDLVRDVLDKRILDCDDNIVGRVDGLIMHISDDGQPRITDLSVGGSPLFARLGKWAVPTAKFFARLWGPHRKSAVRIPWSDIEHFGRDVKLTIGADDTEAMAWENWIRDHVIEKIPGSGSK